jgi:hypothetical protein
MREAFQTLFPKISQQIPKATISKLPRQKVPKAILWPHTAVCSELGSKSINMPDLVRI